MNPNIHTGKQNLKLTLEEMAFLCCIHIMRSSEFITSNLICSSINHVFTLVKALMAPQFWIGLFDHSEV